MSNLIPFSDAKQRDTDSGPLVKMTDFSSLMLPSFESDEDLEANSPSRQVEKLTPSTPILMPESTRATTIGSKTLSAAELRTKLHCRKCPFPSCSANKIGFHKIDSAYPLRGHMEACHSGRIDHDEPFLCPVRTCEYSVLGFKTLDINMKHLSIYHDASRPFEHYSSDRSFTPEHDSTMEEGLCDECSRNDQGVTATSPEPPGSIQDFKTDSQSPSYETESEASDSASQLHETDLLKETMAAIALDLLDILGHDMVLLARLMPQIHTNLQQCLCIENASYAGSDYGAGGDSTGEFGGLASSDSRKSSTSSSHRKRGRDDKEEDDERDDGDSERFKKPKGKPESNENKGPRYACPFHKRWPQKYTNLEGTKYRSCSGPGQVEVRRLKAHLGKVHKHLQCEKCYSFFDEQLDLTNHRRSAECQQQSDSLKEGIDESQWVLIEDILRVRRPKEKDKSDVEKWYDVWRVLFPNVPIPEHPYHDHARTPMPQPTHDIENRLATVGTIINQDSERDNYRLEPETYRRCMAGIRRFLEAEKATARHAPALSLDMGYSVDPQFTAFSISQPFTLSWEAPSYLPSHVNPSLLDQMSSPSIQESLYSPFNSGSDGNATFDSNLPIGPQTFSQIGENNPGGNVEAVSSNTQSVHIGLRNHIFDDGREPQPSTLGNMHTAATSDTLARLSANHAAPQAMSWSQEDPSFRQNAVAARNLNSHVTENQYAAPAVSFDAGGSFEYDVEPDSIASLLGSELAAVTIRPAGTLSKAELANMGRELYPPSGGS